MLPEERPLIEKELKMLGLIHVAMMAGIFIFALVITLMDVFREGPPPIPESFPVMQILVPVYGLMMIISGNLVYKKLISSIPTEVSIQEKMMKYRAFSLVQYAMLESAALFSLVVFFLTKDLLSFVVAGVILLAFFFSRPSTDKCITDLRL
jgi:F0F1-type ATP synthase membrane subunit c/vacuolar-type H+-ATPase subunit K